MAFVDVGALGDLRDRIPHVVSIGRRELVLVRWGERVYALKNVCPHQTQSFNGGAVHSRIEPTGRPGEITIDPGRPILTCPWHHWEYDIQTGRCPVDTKLRVRAYDVTIHGDRVLVDVTRTPKT